MCVQMNKHGMLCLITVTSTGNKTKHTLCKKKQSRDKHPYQYRTSDFSHLN